MSASIVHRKEYTVLCQYLLDEALVSTVPGEAYNVPGKIRISYSNSMENLEIAVERIAEFLSEIR